MTSTNSSRTGTRVYFATAAFDRAWGQYLFLAEERAGTWRLFTWRDEQWQQVDPFHFNVIYAAAKPRIVVAQESDVEAIVPGATLTDVAWQSKPQADDFTDWSVLVRGYLDDDSRRAALESMVEHGDVTFSDADDHEDYELDSSDKLSILEETVPDSEILDMHDMTSLRMKYLIAPSQHQRVV